MKRFDYRTMPDGAEFDNFVEQIRSATMLDYGFQPEGSVGPECAPVLVRPELIKDILWPSPDEGDIDVLELRQKAEETLRVDQPDMQWVEVDATRLWERLEDWRIGHLD